MEKMRVAAVSTRNWVGQPNRSIKNMAGWARKAVDKGAEFVLFPELCVSGYFYSAHAWDVAGAHAAGCRISFWGSRSGPRWRQRAF